MAKTKRLKKKKAKNRQKRANTSRKKKQETIQDNLRKVASPIIKPMFAMPRKAGRMKLF
tara:strand:+ start:347 stop:523 length:177 start_codon:yes stop_codon:yes gene_type:complete